jgi:hypothetical protein
VHKRQNDYGIEKEDKTDLKNEALMGKTFLPWRYQSLSAPASKQAPIKILLKKQALRR